MNRRNNELMNDVNDPFFDNLARRFFGPVSDWMDWATPSIASTAVNGLLTDVKETKDAYEVHVDVPGINKDNITDHADKNGNVMMSERNYGTMSRSYQLPNVDDSNIKASYKDGVLNITLPKLTESKESGHNIDIQ